MVQIRKSAERGNAEHGWLQSFHTFAFAEYYDPDFLGYRVLRVINEDFIGGGKGFPTHPHRDMEIVTYVIEGALEHKDTLGSSSVIRPGEVQYMCAGTGVQHSEFNHLPDQKTHLYQIWIIPNRHGYPPAYAQKNFSEKMKSQDLTLVVSEDGREGSIAIHQSVDLHAAKWDSGREVGFKFRGPNRFGWLQVVSGEVGVAGQTLMAGDGAAVAGETALGIKSGGPAEFLMFDLP
jgi:redox-sensitive bicupin YhaK (pirin superfamily)